jgi:hypothetical protein
LIDTVGRAALGLTREDARVGVITIDRGVKAVGVEIQGPSDRREHEPRDHGSLHREHAGAARATSPTQPG